MFLMQIPPEVQGILEEMDLVYPRLAKQIRLMWSDDQECQNFFSELLTYKADYDRQGFTIEAYRKLDIVQKAYQEQLFQYQTRHLSSEQREKLRRADVWALALNATPQKAKKKPWEQS